MLEVIEVMVWLDDGDDDDSEILVSEHIEGAAESTPTQTLYPIHRLLQVFPTAGFHT